MEAMMIKDVMVRLDGTRADEVRLAAVDQIAEYFDSHVIGLFLNVLPVLIPRTATARRGRVGPARGPGACRRRQT